MLPTDKGKSVVNIDKSEYIENCDKLQSDRKTYVN